MPTSSNEGGRSCVHAAAVRNGGVVTLSSTACGSGVEITDGPDPVLALAAVADLRSVAHPNR